MTQALRHLHRAIETLQGPGVGTNKNLPPTSFQRTDPRHHRRKQGQRSAAPRVIDRAGVVRHLRPAFPERAVRVFGQTAVAPAHAVEPLRGASQRETGFEHILFHVRRSLLGAEQCALHLRVVLGSGNAAEHHQRLHAVIGQPGKIRRMVSTGRGIPIGGLDGGADFGQLLESFPRCGLLAQRRSHQGHAFHREGIPRVERRLGIDPPAPVDPIPDAMLHAIDKLRLRVARLRPVSNRAVVLQSPDLEITDGQRIDSPDRFKVTGVQVIGPDAKTAQDRKHLRRQFDLPIPLGDRSVEHAIGALPAERFQQRFAHQQFGRAVQTVGHLTELHHEITGPLRALAARTVHEVVAHGHAQSLARLEPQAVEQIVVAGETAGILRRIGRLEITETGDFERDGKVVDDCFRVDPSRKNMMLVPRPREVYGTQTRCVVLRGHADAQAGPRLALEDREQMTVGRQPAQDAAPAVRFSVVQFLFRHVGLLLRPIPQRNRPFFEFAPRQAAGHPRRHRFGPRRVVELRRGPTFQFAPRVITDAALRQPVSVAHVAGIEVGRMLDRLPWTQPPPGGCHPQTGRATVAVRESGPAEIGEQDRQLVFPVRQQVGRNADRVIIRPAGHGSPLQSPLPDQQPAVDKKIVFAVGGDLQHHLGKLPGTIERRPEGIPAWPLPDIRWRPPRRHAPTRTGTAFLRGHCTTPLGSQKISFLSSGNSSSVATCPST